ncbi:hypothetical protein N7520_001994 [Penicillium odoratum]|uniref:uncharacterized protein n=1 Tax=Penicillium odoratum TaxID=1167516 RepID=UPI002548FABD|nr:uncharacterized protein N7520_001994 [Penicillium odoratum]KAJ5778748.1 hypothetical protein N7520_001994 [Penicillium odoratum]
MAETFLEEAQQIEAVRKLISPSTRTTVGELATMDPLRSTVIHPNYKISDEYWIVVLGIDTVGGTQLVDILASALPRQWLITTPAFRLHVYEFL